MPLFGSKKEAPQTITTTTTHKQAPSTRSSGLFSRNKSSSISPDGRSHTTTTANHANTSPNRHSSILSKSTGNSGGLLHRNHEDPSISSARERVMRAETAEREADKALIAARASVKEARAEVKRLEHEAAEEVSFPTCMLPMNTMLIMISGPSCKDQARSSRITL